MHAAVECGTEVRVVSEDRSSISCDCAMLLRSLGGKKVFMCPNPTCEHFMKPYHRDSHASRSIMLLNSQEIVTIEPLS